MRARLHCLYPMVALLGIVVWSPAGPLFAQAPPASSEDGGPDQEVVREQSIYIPYDKLRQVFEKHGRGVFLPYEEFQKLWKDARMRAQPPVEQKPPVGALITEIENEATVAKDVIRVKARLKIEVLAEGWNEIPLRLADAAITGATLADQPARITGNAKQGYRLLVEKKGKQPQQIELALEYAKAITKAPGRNSVSLQAPQAPVSRWRVRIPQSGVKVNIHSLIAATEVPTEQLDGTDAESQPQGDETVVLAFVGAAPAVRIDWTPKAEGAMGLEALASVQAEQEVRVGEGVTRTDTRLDYTISRAELAELIIEVPADQKVVNVFDPNVRQWSVQKVDDRQRITAQLFQPARASQQVTVELEQFADGRPAGTLKVPVVKALGADRQQGVLVVQVEEGLRATATPTMGLLQIDVPKSLAGGKWDFSYRYATAEYALELQVEKVQPRILADALVEAYLEPERLAVDLSVVYTVQRAGVFQLELDVPAGFEVRQVRGRAVAGAREAEVDAYELKGPDKTRLLVNLARKAVPSAAGDAVPPAAGDAVPPAAGDAVPASRDGKGDDGRVALVVNLQKELPQSNLLTPGGKQEIPLPLPRVAPETVQRATGRLVVYAPESLRLNPGKTEGLQSVSPGEALKGMQSARSPRPEGVRAVLSFTYAQEPGAEQLITLPLAAERRKPQVTVSQLLAMRIDSGVVKYEATFFYNVLYSGVESLWIDVPAKVSEKLRSETPGVNEEKGVEPPAGYEPQGDVWKFTGESELLGQGQIRLVWEDKDEIEKLGIGQPVDLAVPYLQPVNVDRSWGQIVLAKAETIDVQQKGESAVLQPIDPQHDLMPRAQVTGAARAFEFHDDWALTVIATQYKLEEVKRTSLEQSVVRMVVTRANEISVQALYRIRSARQRLKVKLPAKPDFDTEPARINGRPVMLQGGDEPETYLIPLVDTGADEPFVLELRYMVSGDSSRLDLPQFPEEPAVQKVYLCAYLPEELALLGTVGQWTGEFTWRIDPALNWKPRALTGVPRLIGQLCQDVEMTGDPAESFQTDGQLYVFSTLRPDEPPGGSLEMRVLDEIVLNSIVFLAVTLGGLILLPAGAGRRAFAIGLLVVAVVLCGVFLPTFSLQILDGVLGSAIFIVLVAWVVWFFVRTYPRILAERRAVRVAAPPPVPAPAQPRPLAPQDQARPDSQKGGKTDA